MNEGIVNGPKEEEKKGKSSNKKFDRIEKSKKFNQDDSIWDDLNT